MPRRRINVEKIKNSVLWLLHYSMFEHTGDELDLDHISEMINQSPVLVEIALDGLESESLCLKYNADNLTLPMINTKPSTCYKITMKGIELVENWPDKFHDEVVKSTFPDMQSSELQQLFASTKAVEEELAKEIPASDRYVTITHNQEYQETLRTLDDAILQFKEDHHLDNELGQEKGALVAALEGGRKLLDDTRIWVSTAISTLVDPLRRIDSLYKQAAVQGSVASLVYSALEKILKLLGL